MKLNNDNAELFIPDNLEIKKALDRITHLSIGAHPDDLEIMSFDGILKCYKKNDEWFMGVIVTNGVGSSRAGVYKDYTDEEMQNIRKIEQKKAAKIGEFGALALLDYPSIETKDPNNKKIIEELTKLISLSKPKVIYTHNLADKHDTHLGVAVKTIQAIRLLDKEVRPKKLYGCEVWRNLDWMMDSDKVSFNVSGNKALAKNLIIVYDSQVAGGKRYDLATLGRRLANATYSSSYSVDESDSVIYAMDLTPLIVDDSLDIVTYVTTHIERFMKDVHKKLSCIL